MYQRLMENFTESFDNPEYYGLFVNIHFQWFTCFESPTLIENQGNDFSRMTI